MQSKIKKRISGSKIKNKSSILKDEFDFKSIENKYENDEIAKAAAQTTSNGVSGDNNNKIFWYIEFAIKHGWLHISLVLAISLIWFKLYITFIVKIIIIY